MLGLGSIGTTLLCVGLVIGLILMMFVGIVRGLGFGAVWGLGLLTLAYRDKKHEKSLASKLVERGVWSAAKLGGTTVYRSGPIGRTPWGTFQLPGLAAQSKLSEGEDAYGRPFAVLNVPAARTVAVVIASEPDGAALVDADQVDDWVATWGGWLAMLANEPGLRAVSVTIETAPDPGHRLRQEVSLHMDPNAPDFARRVMEQVVEAYPSGSSSIHAYTVLTFGTASISGKKRTIKEVTRDLALRLPALTQHLSTTGAGTARPVDGAELCEIVRTAYDPAAGVLFDAARAAGQSLDVSWSDVGPSAFQASWDAFRHDSGISVSWTMTSPPRGVVHSNVLSRLVSPHRAVPRKRVTLLYRPVDPARAAALVEADVRSAMFASSSQRRPSSRNTFALRSATATAEEEAQGAGLVNFGAIVTATVLDPEDLPEARAAIDGMSAQARVLLRPAYGAQDTAFVAGLPLGLVLSDHLAVPANVRGAL